MAAFYLLSLALGVSLVSVRGSNVDLLHVLFGSVLALDNATLLLLASIASVTLVGLAAIYRPLGCWMSSTSPSSAPSAGPAR